MWWSDEIGGAGRRWTAIVLFAVLGLVLGSCGFRPLYGPAPSAEFDPKGRLAQVRIEPLQHRVGQQLHNLLRDRLNPSGPPRKPGYDLSLRLISSIENTGIRIDETATRSNLILRATYGLYVHGTEELLVSGRVASFNSFNLLSAFYATTVSEADALERGLREVADDVALRLAIYFSDPEPGKSKPELFELEPGSIESDPGSPDDLKGKTDSGPVDTGIE